MHGNNMGTTPPLSDEAYLALAVWDEARGEPSMGQRAVAQVVRNRAALKFHSDGTIRGTVLAKDQFSGFYFDFIGGRYQRVCHDEAGADIRAHQLLIKAHDYPAVWDACEAAVTATTVRGAWPLPKDAVLYYNPAVVHAPPPWATPDKYVTTIGHHAFYRS